MLADHLQVRAAGRTTAVISSSGNAALAAATYGAAAGVRVVAFISPLTGTARAVRLRDAGARVIVTPKPINYSLRLCRVTGWPDLRPSVSVDALSGFRTLGIELARELPAQMPIFGYASSGTTFEAIGQVFAASGGDHPLHPVQAGLVNGLSRAFGRSGDGRRSLVGDLGVKVTPRASAVIDMVRRSGGQAWWVADTEIAEARGALEREGIDAATECWAALAGIREAAGAGGIEEACLLLTGRSWGESGDQVQPDATSFAEVLSLVADLR